MAPPHVCVPDTDALLRNATLAQVDQANNIALLELFLALFLGLLFRVNVVSDDAAEGALFEVVAALLGLFIFVYPVVSLLPALTQAGGGPMV